MDSFILQWNIRSLTKNKPFLSKLCSDTLPKIICIHETQAKPSSNLKIPGYNVVSRLERVDRDGGGVAILAIPSVPVISLPLSSDLEVCRMRH